MNAITLWQPWASLIAWGYKTIETRQHGRFAGLVGAPLAIHAGGRFDHAAADLIDAALGLAGLTWPDGLDYDRCCSSGGWPRGCVVAVAQNISAHRILTHADTAHALCPAEGLHGLDLAGVLPLLRPLGARGAQGVWRWTPAVPLHRVTCPHCCAAALAAEGNDLYAVRGLENCPRCRKTFAWRREGAPSPFNPQSEIPNPQSSRRPSR